MIGGEMLGERRNRLVGAVRVAFDGKDLKPVAQLVDQGLLVHVNWDQATHSVVESVFSAAQHLGGSAWLEAVVRSARRARPDNHDLANAVLSCWPYARELTPQSVDELVAALRADGVPLDELEPVVVRLARSFEPLRPHRGDEALADLVERLAGYLPAPGESLPLFRVAAALRTDRRPAITGWYKRAGSVELRGSVDETTTAAPRSATRMLIVLLPEDDDRYSVEVFLSDPANLPRPVAAVDRPCQLADIPSRISEQLSPGTPLFEALYASNIEQIDVALPLRDVLAAVDEWTFRGRVLSIGRAHRVVVRCLERNLPSKYPDFFLAFNAAIKTWRGIREMHALSDRCVVRWFEVAEQLTRANVEDALGHHAMMKWLVAAVCTDAPAAARREALEMMIREGVTAALWVRGDAPSPARPLLEPACTQPLRLPLGIHEHRNSPVKLPVTLLWDDQDFRPEKWR